MPTPLFNEELISQMLGAPPAAETGQQLRTAAFFMLLDAYDRKVDRETFSEVAKNAVQLTEMMGRLESTTGLYSTFNAEKLTKQGFADALAIITGHAESCRLALVNQMSLIIQCPWSDETIN